MFRRVKNWGGVQSEPMLTRKATILHLTIELHCVKSEWYLSSTVQIAAPFPSLSPPQFTVNRKQPLTRPHEINRRAFPVTSLSHAVHIQTPGPAGHTTPRGAVIDALKQSTIGDINSVAARQTLLNNSKKNPSQQICISYLITCSR